MIKGVGGKETLLWILAAALLILAIALYEFRSSLDLRHTDPHAIEEIEKAKQR